MVIEADLVAELAAEQDVERHVEELAGEIPEGHLDAAHGALLGVGAAVGVAVAGVDGVDLQRVGADEGLLNAVDLLANAEPRGAVGLGEAGDAGVGVNAHQGVAAGAL